MSEGEARGSLGVFADLVNFLRIYKERDFWIQIAATILGIFLWMIILPSQEIFGAIAASPTLIFLNFIMTNIVWAASRKPYSCILGSSFGYGLYNLAVSVIVYHLSLSEILKSTFLGTVYGFVFAWFAFVIFNFVGLVKTKKG